MLTIWLNIGILGKIKIGLVFGFCGCHFVGIGLVSVSHFSENGISARHFLHCETALFMLRAD